jgi:hypothetical protein
MDPSEIFEENAKPSIQEKTDELLRFLTKVNDYLKINSVDFPRPQLSER